MDPVRSELERFHESLIAYHIPRWEELPDIELYMDQVIVLMEKYLSVFLKAEEDRMITPSMINNYVKLSIIPPPVKKRYSRTHLAYLIMVILLKQVLSISEIRALITQQLTGRDIVELFNHFCNEQEEAFQAMASQNQGVDAKDADLALKMAALAGAGKTLAKKIVAVQAEILTPPQPEEPEEESKKSKKKKEDA